MPTPPFVTSTSKWTALIGAGLSLKLASRKKKLSDLDFWAHNAERLQHEQLASLMRLAQRTEIGRELRFTKLLASSERDRLRAYREAIAPADYEAWRPHMARMREGGEPDVTWPGLVMDWAQTSGTTGGEKYIPVTQQMMKSNYRAALDIFCHVSRFGLSLSSMFAGNVLFMGGSTKVDTNEHGVRTGDLSGLVTPLIKWPLSEVYSPGKDVALMDHWPTKIEQMAELCIGQDIRGVSGMASWGLVLFERVLEMARERDPSIRTLRDVWPNLDLFIHGGVKYPPFDPRVREVWSGDGALEQRNDIPFRIELYPASEGFIAVQDTRHDPGLRLHTDIGNFYEFIPLEEIDDPEPRAFMCHEVEKGQRYVVCMTTCSGLWRYVIGDVVVFETVPPDGPPRLRIVGRHRHFMNAFGENLIVEEIERAVVHAQSVTGARTGEFTASPVYPGDGRRSGMELVIEWDADDDTLARFAEAFDAHLRSINVDYNTKRTDSMGMAPPTTTPVPIGAFHRWMDARGKLGGQNKCPRLANHRDFVDGVRSIV
ncbi:MAG: GH3 auxin-responsive promoter family protein [Planctomycetota bacterium]